MTILGIVLLIIIGIGLLILEFFVVPGITIAGIGGALLLVAGTYMAFNTYGTSTGSLVLTIAVISLFILIGLALRADTWNKVSLNSEIKSRVESIDESQIKKGDTGITASRLAPMGKVLINNQYVEAVSHNQYIDNNIEIEVIKVQRTNVVVKIKEV